jgi:DNA-binding response OmpR family regulator
MSAAMSSEPARAEGRRVLVVDDDRLLATLLADALERRGMRAMVAHAPEPALELAESFRPQVALVDLGLPSIDGHELGVRLRAARAGGLTLIAFTGYDEPWARERSLELGFAAHLVKPVRLAELRRLIEEVPAAA